MDTGRMALAKWKMGYRQGEWRGQEKWGRDRKKRVYSERVG